MMDQSKILFGHVMIGISFVVTMGLHQRAK